MAASSTVCPDGLGQRHLISIDDLSLGEMRALFERARSFSEDLRGHSDLCRGLISASLFYEPSTRTRLSFESAMLRLGGGILTAAEISSTSAAKGESLADTVRVVSGGYADIITLRHASEGAARLAAQYSAVPVVNAGDGSHEHPTQTLCDLYSLWIERGRIEGLNVLLSGDLRYSRTIHSFVFALARFGANIVCAPHPGFELPPYVVHRLRDELGVEPSAGDRSRLGEIAKQSDVVYLTPQRPHQLSLFTDARDISARTMAVDRIDAVYMTRAQTERHTPDELAQRYQMQIGKQEMAAEPLRNAVVMHPLPRRDEISSEIDGDPRSIYFKQASRGVPIRMAILGFLLGRIELNAEPEAVGARYFPAHGENPCRNPSCISRTEARHVTPMFKLASRLPLRAHCGYCSQQISFTFIGCSTTRIFHEPDSVAARQIRADHLVFFADEAQALNLGFSRSSRPGVLQVPGV